MNVLQRIRKIVNRTKVRIHHLKQDDAAAAKYEKYRDDPVGFAHDILRVKLVPLQQKALKSLLESPYRVLCPSANEVGKSMAGACAILWWHCTRVPSIIITTAPKLSQVRDILWKEVRRLGRRAKLQLAFLPKDCRIERAPDDFAMGVTAKDATSFQGHHGPSILFVIDEATAVAGEFFEAIESMFSPPGHAVLCLFNPTATGTRVHAEMMGAEKPNPEAGKAWHIVRMNALDHPNIEAELRGQPPSIPHAIRLAKFDRLFRKWSQLVGCALDDKTAPLATDIVWPPVWAKEYCERTGQKPRWWRPGPIAEARLLGRYPRQGTNSVWSDGDWIAATREGLEQLPLQLWIPEIGCDVAAGGEDMTAIHVRIGFCSCHHEEGNWTGPQIMQNLRSITADYARWYNECCAQLPASSRPRPITAFDIPIKIDCDGIGTRDSEFLEAEGYNVIRVGAGTKALMEKEYPNRRSELWFTVAEMARADELDLTRLPEEVLEECRKQFMAVTWSLDSHGRRVVCPKDEMRQLMGRSPDTADSVNLAYAEVLTDPTAMPEVLYSRHRPTEWRSR